MSALASSRLRSAAVAFFTGSLFAAGLLLSGMTKPAKVIGFLDVAGAWDPSLALVMIGAIGVHFVARRFILRRSAPVAAPSFAEPVRRHVDAPLVVGAAIFGVGWGGAGYCPGPSIVTLGSGSLDGVVFVLAMLGGIALHGALRPRVGALVEQGAQAARALRGEPLPPGARTDG